VAAVRAALTLPIALVTGGPGTGKTTVIAALLRALRSGPMMDVALAAPTGKAALRMREIVEAYGQGSSSHEPTAMTLHRLLGWSPTKQQFARGEGDPLPYGLIVVDEASMIDLVLMDRLLRALRSNAQLVLLGDPNQLPSVDAGAIFRDLCTVLEPARLTMNLRVAREPSARSLVTVAEIVQRGAPDLRLVDAIAVRPTPSRLVFAGVEHLSEPWAVVGNALLDRWWTARIRALDDFGELIDRVYRAPSTDFDDASLEALRVLSRHYAGSRLLCATRSRQVATGAEALNDDLLFRLRAETGRLRQGWGLPPGTPVLAERNDYARDLWNGDQGIVVWVDAGRGPELRAVFPRDETFVHFPLSELTALTPAFATTVHKAQGSEFDHVAVVLPEAGSPLSTRELLYTAITRARRSVLLVGEPERLAHALSRSVTRESGVAERLATMKD
jgi:exodeoxyribonuclease V alpha subunit